MDYLEHISFKKEDMSSYASDCSCMDCEYFREYFSYEYEYIVPFLEQFGLKCEDAIKIADNGIDMVSLKRSYTAYYCVKGTVDTDKIEFKLNELDVLIHKNETAPPVDIEEPFFYINIYGILLEDNEAVIKEALMTGREIEYIYDGSTYFISRRNFKPYISNEATGEETFFSSTDELYYSELKDIIEDIKIEFIY